MAIYQRFDHVKKTSRWIFVQAPDDFAEEVRSELSVGGQGRLAACDIYRQVFSIAEQEWRDYIRYLDAELATLVRCDFVLQSLIRNFFDSSLGRKGFFCRCRRLQRIRLPNRIRRQSEASAASSEISEMQRDTRLLLGSCPGLQEALAGHLFTKWAMFGARSHECRRVHFSN